MERSKSPRLPRRFCAGLFVLAASAPLPVAAQVESTDLAKQACQIAKTQRLWQGIAPVPDAEDEKSEWIAIDPQRLWFFAATRAGIEVTPDGSRRQVEEAFNRMNDDKRPAAVSEADRAVFFTIKTLQDDLAAGTVDMLKIFDEPNPPTANAPRESSRFWLADQRGILRCKVAKPLQVADGSGGAAAGGAGANKPQFIVDLNLRETPEALSLTGKARKSAGAAQLALERVRSFLDDGTRKQVTTLTGKGVLGLRLVPQTDDSSLFAYVAYELSEARTKPSTPPTPPATLRDGDTEVIRLGLIGSQYFDLTPGLRADQALTVSLDGAYLFDLVKDSERLRTKVTLAPYAFVKAGGLCGIREFQPTFIAGVRARCTPDILFQYNHVTRDGKLTADEKMDFLLFGGRFTYDLMLAGDLESGMFAGGSYEYQKRLSGGVPSIRRHRLYIKYRLWVGDDFAVDIGPELIDGINPDSFADENKLVLKTGLIF